MEYGEPDGIGGISEESIFYKDRIQFFFSQRAKPKVLYITGGKTLLTIALIEPIEITG